MSDNLRQVIIRVKKSDAALLYFILEANENIAFYSTLENDSLSPDYRDIEINCHKSLEKQLGNFITHFGSKYELEVLQDHYL